jgi:amino acid transporter
VLVLIGRGMVTTAVIGIVATLTGLYESARNEPLDVLTKAIITGTTLVLALVGVGVIWLGRSVRPRRTWQSRRCPTP